MQGYQFHTSALSADYLDKLITSCTILSTLGYECTQRVVDGGLSSVPGSPGRARNLHPYPPSRRRRQ